LLVRFFQFFCKDNVIVRLIELNFSFQAPCFQSKIFCFLNTAFLLKTAAQNLAFSQLLNKFCFCWIHHSGLFWLIRFWINKRCLMNILLQICLFNMSNLTLINVNNLLKLTFAAIEATLSFLDTLIVSKILFAVILLLCWLYVYEKLFEVF
jgi:hypothetical protein